MHIGRLVLACGILFGPVSTAAQTLPDLTEIIASSYREAARDAPELVKVLGVKPGHTVADIGAGFGGWSVALARIIGPQGRVFATEIGQLQLATMRDIIAREQVSNITIIEGAGEGTNLPENCCDAVFMRNVYHLLPEPEPMVESVFRALRPGGRFAVIDFVARPGSALPPGVRKSREGNGIPISVAVDELKASRFRYVETITAWPPGSKPPSYFVVLLEKPQE